MKVAGHCTEKRAVDHKTKEKPGRIATAIVATAAAAAVDIGKKATASTAVAGTEACIATGEQYRFWWQEGWLTCIRAEQFSKAAGELEPTGFAKIAESSYHPHRDSSRHHSLLWERRTET